MAEDEETEIIARLRDQFEEHCETLDGLRPQTNEEWLGKRRGKSKHAKWKSKASEFDDSEVGLKVSDWKEIPYTNKTVEANLAEEIEFAKELRDGLIQQFDAKSFDTDFSVRWGLFCYLIGGFDTLLNAKPENRAAARSKASGHKQEDKKSQTLWFSLLYLELQNDPEFKNRAAIEDAIVETINCCISVDFGREDGFGKNWFRLLLGDPKKELDHHLASAFRDKKFSIEDIEKAAKHRAYRIPQFKGLQRLQQN